MSLATPHHTGKHEVALSNSICASWQVIPPAEDTVLLVVMCELNTTCMVLKKNLSDTATK